ncbi:MAG: hypothetical protein KDK91_04970 [Gammaproteobacteria bacterium]|nr:hypothetical protein [Gammaproteobacteria bacterium]
MSMAGNADHPLTRHSREAVGALVLLSVVLFVFAATQAGRLDRWLNPGVTVRVLMPPEGLYGLSSGADVEILGTIAGEVREIVIEPDQNMHALVNLRREAMSFVRQDSQAFIKRRFGVAGDAYLEITRGVGAPLDESYVVLQASGERIPTQTVEQLISELRERAIPILDQAELAIKALAQVATMVNEGQDDVREFLATLNSVAGSIERGQGTLGRLVVDDTLIRRLESVLGGTADAIERLTPMLEHMQGTVRNVSKMSEKLGEQADALPQMTRRASAALASLQSVMEDVSKTTPALPALTRNVAQATEQLPGLLLQTETALVELQTLIRQLQASWLLGGSSEPRPGRRISPLEVTP